MPSQDGKGRTLWDILVGRNKRPATPLELQYHNPLGAKVGNTVSFDHRADIGGINFVIEQISVYETRLGAQKFHHTDYHLKGMSIDMDRPLKLRLRLIPDEDVNNKVGHSLQLLTLYDEMEWSEDAQAFHDNVLMSDTGVFEVNQDDEGNALETPDKYWRVEDVLDPYNATVTVLRDKDGDGAVEEEELDRYDVTYWDYSRLTNDPENGQEFIEFLTVEMKNASNFICLFRGTEVEAFQVTVV